MPATAYVARILDQLSSHGAPTGVDTEVFTAFVRAVGRQLRQPYRTRYGTADVLTHLGELFDTVAVRAEDAITVRGVHEDGTTVFLTNMADQPFIVDTLLLVLRRQGFEYLGGFNVILSTTRDANGRLVGVGAPDGASESLVRAEVDGLAAEDVPRVEAEIRRALGLAAAMVRDFPAMIELVESAGYRLARQADRTPDQAEGPREASEFVRWLLNDDFVFMGAVYGEQRLGIAREEVAQAGGLSTTALLAGWEPGGALPVSVRKSPEESPVHRAGRLDEIRVDVRTDRGDEVKPLYIQGLFTYKAMTQASRTVPVLRQVLARILAREEAKPGSFRYRGTANAFDSLPTEFLFTAPSDEIGEMIDRVLESEQERRVRVYIRQKPSKAMAIALVAMPKGGWSDKMRAEIQRELVGALGASYVDHGVFIGRYDTMLLHFFLTGVTELSEEQHEALVARVTALATPWVDRLYERLLVVKGEDAADDLIVRYGTAFDEDYQRRSPVDRAIRDIDMLERLGEERAALCDVFQDDQGCVNLRIYQRTDIILSDILPVLDNVGLVVIAEYADTVSPRGAAPVSLDTFRVQEVSGVSREEVMARAPLLIAGLEAVFTQKIPNDVLNRLILRAGLDWQAVDALRAYNGFARQLGQRYTLARVAEILGARPDLLGLLWALFEARFDPTRGAGREAAVEAAREAFQDALRAVTDADQDATFRNLQNLVDSTLRTNFYRKDRPYHYISMKYDCALVRSMPSPRMQKEIYVHHREVEGVHLRGGPIARGGLRWSDREDFRREILGLVSTQMVKNVLIVPEGSKGGFFLKHPGTRDPRELRRKADELYKTFIRGLLDLTDNYVDGKVVPPPDVVRWDGDDPYLVVAADKGTAHLSNTANTISKEYGFWLGDAFASGGSNGYDHKEVGITARGAWVLAARHFREMGRDPYRDEFTAVGIGDTGGDVFGNGVIETPKMKLLAAFNHLHVFLDPNPDPEKSYQERLRLFREVKGWEHYDRSLISEGGGIFDRKAKSIPLSPEVQKMLGVLQSELPVDTVIRHILRMDVDMLLNGGIGTYVKASQESHQDAGDATNDELRVNANELRCRMAFEGGNLGFTQAGRIEFAMRGGRINNDAVDNSGGVDLSDHEVNLKILLNPMVAAGRLGLEERNTLLESMTEEVAQSVLANNNRHGRQISLDLVRSLRDPMQFSRVIDWVTARGGRSRAELALPSDEDLARRASVGQGMTRPELAVLQAHVKMHVKKALLSADPTPIPGFDEIVLRYFPKTVQERFAADIPRHMLHRNIGMTYVLGHVAGEAGLAFFPTMMELTGAGPAVIAGAWLHAMKLVGADEIMAELRASDASIDVKYQAWVELNDQVQGLVALWLAPGEPGPWGEDLGAIAEALRTIPGNRSSAQEERARARADQLVGIKVPAGTAQRIVNLEDLVTAREVALLGSGGANTVADIVRYLAVGEASRILPALQALGSRKAQGRWDAIAMGVLKNRFLSLLRQMVRGLELGPAAQLGVDRVAMRLARGPLAGLQAEMDRVLGDQPDVPTLLVAEERIRSFVATTTLGDIGAA